MYVSNSIPLKILYFMNEVPYAFPASLAERIDECDSVDVTVVSLFDDVSDEVEGGPLDVVTLGATGRFDFAAYRQLRRLIEDRNPDIVHTHPNATGSIARLVAKTTGVNIVDTRHTDHRYLPMHHRIPNLVATPVTDRFISNSQTTRSSFSTVENFLLGLTGGQHEVVYNGISPDLIRNLPPESADLPDGPRIISIARYVPEKNHQTLIEAMPAVLESLPDAKLVLVGDGPRFETIKSLIGALGLNESVVQTGHMRRPQALSALANSELFAISSQYEGFCLAAVEAMFTETPVVASDIPVLREVVDEAGRFAPPDEPQQFADHIISLLEHDEARAALGKRAGERARSTFSLDQTAEGYVRTYRDLMSER